VLFLRKYENASTWLHKFRRPIVRPGRDLLTGRAGFVHTDGWRGYNGTTARDAYMRSALLGKCKRTTSELPPRESPRPFAPETLQAVGSVTCDLIVHPNPEKQRKRRSTASN
jgi:hypothetical protein